MSMTRQHFEKVAAILTEVAMPRQRAELAHRFADWFEDENPRFDRTRFMVAAGVDTTGNKGD
jgi:hypothetical protein